jgi:hypothetical protein
MHGLPRETGAARARAKGALTLALTLAACNGNIGDHTKPPVVITPPSPLCNGLDPGPSFIRRVNRLEYDNTVRDLLQTTLTPARTFPPEERRLGFDDNGAALSTSPVLTEQLMLAAEQLAADAVANHWSALVPCAQTATDIDACGADFIATFGRRAYRRPLDADDSAILKSVFDAGKATDLKTGVRLVITAVLQSPDFLYRVEFGRQPVGSDPKVTVKHATSGAVLGQASVVRVGDWEMASRLSYLLWRSMPDDALFAAAEGGRLSSDADIAAEVQRMLADPKARVAIADFHDQWLRIGEVDVLDKESNLFAGWNANIPGLMRQEARTFVDDVIWNGDGTMDALFTAPYTFANATLAQYYGLPAVSGSSFVKVPLEASQRGGVLTQGGLMSLLAKSDQTSPVHRGKFVREQVFCQILQPPPPDIEIVPPELSSTLTTRERFAQHSADDACSGCHQLTDPIGLGFENFDGAGKFRSTENGKAVDISGEIVGTDVAGKFNGPIELGQKLAASETARACVTTQWFRYGYGRAETAADGCSMKALNEKFAGSGYRVLDLVAALAATDAFRYRRFITAGGAQ